MCLFGKKTKEALSNISDDEIQARLDNFQSDKSAPINITINNGCCDSRKTEVIRDIIDVSDLDFREQTKIHGSKNIYVGIHSVDGVEYDFGNESSEDMVKYDFGNESNMEKKVKEDIFMQSPVLIAEYGSFENYKKDINMDDKINNIGFFQSIFGISKINKELKASNLAKLSLEKETNEKLLSQTEQFKKNTDQDIKKLNAEKVLDGMRSMNKTTSSIKDTVESIDDRLAKLLSGESIKQQSQPQMQPLSSNDLKMIASSVTNELMESFNQMQRDRVRPKSLAGLGNIYDTEIISR